jgi:hypothetical protein
MPIKNSVLSRHGRIVVSLWLALGRPTDAAASDTAVLSMAVLDDRSTRKME